MTVEYILKILLNSYRVYYSKATSVDGYYCITENRYPVARISVYSNGVFLTHKKGEYTGPFRMLRRSTLDRRLIKAVETYLVMKAMEGVIPAPRFAAKDTAHDG